MSSVVDSRRKFQAKSNKKHVPLKGKTPDVEVPELPDFLKDDPEIKAEYERITVELRKLRVISKVDRAALTGYCTAWAEFMFCEKKIDELNRDDPQNLPGYVMNTSNGYQQISVWMQVRNKANDRLLKYLKEFGMSPNSRGAKPVKDFDDSTNGGEWAAL